MPTPALSLLSILTNLDICPLTKNDFYHSRCDYQNGQYDFVIVGGGTAGCVLANRLSKNSSINVLLLEAGDVPSRLSEIPLDFIMLQETAEDYAFKAEQPGFFKGEAYQRNAWPQGHVLGGSSTIDAMLYTPGVPYDYDLWANLTDDPIWGWAHMETKFAELNKMVRTTQYTTFFPGRALLGFAALEAGIPVNGKGMFGYKDHPVTTDDFTRFSMAEAYLKPIMDRPNLCVMVNRRVNKIIIENDVAVGVEVQDPAGVRIIKPRREVIVSAGAINSPKLLLLSGIGPSEQLRSFKLPVHADLPVGQYLQDHFFSPIFVPILDLPMPPYNLLYDAYCLTGQILDNSELANFIGYFNTKGETHRPDIEFIHFEFLMNDSTYLEYILSKFNIIESIASQIRRENLLKGFVLFLPALLHPESHGEVVLQSLDPEVPPKIYPHYLEKGDDEKILIDGINQIVIRMIGTLPFLLTDIAQFDLPDCRGLVFKSDDYWRCYFRYYSGTLYDPAGTCRMGCDKATSVVDSRLRVHGIKKLRVVDSSVIPALVSGHLNIPTCALAENAAEFIRAEHGI